MEGSSPTEDLRVPHPTKPIPVTLLQPWLPALVLSLLVPVAACGGSIEGTVSVCGGAGGCGGPAGQPLTTACDDDCADPQPDAIVAPTATPGDGVAMPMLTVGECGDGRVNAGEVCDDGVNDGSYGGCTVDCTARAAHCGDGNVDEGEVCDDGVNDGAGGGCTPDCSAIAAGCGTSFELWPAICRQDLPEAMADFAEPELPSFYGSEVTVRVPTDLDGLQDGSRVTIVEDQADTIFVNRPDLEFIIADGVTVGRLVVASCTRCLVRGAGPNARVNYLYFQESEDATIDSLLIKADSQFNNLAVDIHDSSRIALINTVFMSPHGAAMFTERVDGLLIAGSSWASTDGGGVNDWGSRFANTSDVVVVDSQIEAMGLQPVLRRAGVSPRHFYLRTTTINLNSPETVLDLGSEDADAYDHMYQQEPTYYVSNLSGRQFLNRYGGTANDDQVQGIYEVTDAVWYTPPAGEDGYFGDPEVARFESGPWRYRLGSPVFNATLSGSYEERHPGWPVRISRSLGVPLSVSNPYDL